MGTRRKGENGRKEDVKKKVKEFEVKGKCGYIFQVLGFDV